MRRAKHNPGMSWLWLLAGAAGAYALYKMAQPSEAEAAEPSPAEPSPEGSSALVESGAGVDLSSVPSTTTPSDTPKESKESKDRPSFSEDRPMAPNLSQPSPRVGSGRPLRPKRQFQPSSQSGSDKTPAKPGRGAGVSGKP